MPLNLRFLSPFWYTEEFIIILTIEHMFDIIVTINQNRRRKTIWAT